MILVKDTFSGLCLSNLFASWLLNVGMLDSPVSNETLRLSSALSTDVLPACGLLLMAEVMVPLDMRTSTSLLIEVKLSPGSSLTE